MRSGTTWLQIMIGAHPLVCTTVELTLFNKYTAPWIKSWKEEAANIAEGRWHQGLPFLWGEDEFSHFLREFLRRVYERVLALNPQATHILDKCPGYSEYVEDINRLLPNARFIHVIRDGRDVAVSLVTARKQIGYGAASIQDSAAVWKEGVRAARKGRQYQDRYMEVRYEDLSVNGVDTLKSVFDFCNLPASGKDVADILQSHQFKQMKAERRHPDKRVKTHEAFYRKGKVGSWQEELDPMQRFLFDRIAGELLHELGYAEDGWWADSSRQRFLLPVLAAMSRVSKRVLLATSVLIGPSLSTHIRAARSAFSSGT